MKRDCLGMWITPNPFHLAILIPLFCMTNIVYSQDKPLTYELSEELNSGYYIGNVATDAKLNKKYNASDLAKLRFSFLTQPQFDREYFYIEESTGIIKTSARIDRDIICPGEELCLVKFDVAVRPVRFFQIIKVSI